MPADDGAGSRRLRVHLGRRRWFRGQPYTTRSVESVCSAETSVNRRPTRRYVRRRVRNCRIDRQSGLSG
ncbi:hypothetical protein HSB1_23390 [Halogranum salarium B-1]|uniref:Uncharacterized protein n=1 Tax=Halogranum salarium B-1 TaxID=1210908 RepID=J3A0R2_9EURY|nr:hypothetical protein HSB1_23390 [Halogranum salarium B-1]